MKVVLFAGGLGSRLAEETVRIPKPMVEVGGKPIILHVMDIYSHWGFNDFVVMRDIYTGGSVSDTINAGSLNLASALIGIAVFVGMTLILLRPKKLAPLLDHSDDNSRI